MDFAQGVQSIADAAKVGEMFQYSVKGVSLPRQLQHDPDYHRQRAVRPREHL